MQPILTVDHFTKVGKKPPSVTGHQSPMRDLKQSMSQLKQFENKEINKFVQAHKKKDKYITTEEKLDRYIRESKSSVKNKKVKTSPTRFPMKSVWKLPSRASAPSPPSSAVGELPPPSPIPPDPPDPSSPLSPQQFPPLSSSSHPSKTRFSTVPKPLKHEIKVPASTSPAMALLPTGLEESDVHLENQSPSPSTVPENGSHKKTALSSVSVPATEEETQTPITFTTIAPKQTSPVITNKASSSTLFPPTQNPSYETLTPPAPPILPSPPLNHQKPLEKTLVERLRILEDKSLKRLAPTTVSETGRPRVLIPDSVYEKGAEIHRDFIICYFNGKPPPFNQIQSVFNHMWGKGKQLEIHNNPRNRSTLVRIRSEYFRQKILDKCIWYVGDSMFHTAQWSSEHSMSTPPLKAIKIWAHLTGVPLDLRHQQGLSLVAGLVGEPKETDDFTRNLVSLTLSHVKVEVDLTEPLPSVVEFERQSGEVVEVLVHYPWTPPTCSHRHELGHIVRNCLQLPSDYAPPNPPPVTKKPSSKTKTSNPSHNTPARLSPIQNLPMLEPLAIRNSLQTPSSRLLNLFPPKTCSKFM